MEVSINMFYRVTQLNNTKNMENYLFKTKDFRIVTSSCLRNVMWTWLMSREISVVQIRPGTTASGVWNTCPVVRTIWELSENLNTSLAWGQCLQSAATPCSSLEVSPSQRLINTLRRPIQWSPQGPGRQGKSWSTLLCMLITLNKQTSNYVEITLAHVQ